MPFSCALGAPCFARLAGAARVVSSGTSRRSSARDRRAQPPRMQSSSTDARGSRARTARPPLHTVRTRPSAPARRPRAQIVIFWISAAGTWIVVCVGTRALPSAPRDRPRERSPNSEPSLLRAERSSPGHRRRRLFSATRAHGRPVKPAKPVSIRTGGDTSVRAFGLPTGSGTTEGACKSLVMIRAKRCGQRWHTRGVDSVLALRSYYMSERLPAFWSVFSAQHNAQILRAA